MYSSRIFVFSLISFLYSSLNIHTMLMLQWLYKIILFCNLFLLIPSLLESAVLMMPSIKSVDKLPNSQIYKPVAISSMLVASKLGVCIPMLGKTIPALRTEKDIFFIVKASLVLYWKLIFVIVNLEVSRNRDIYVGCCYYTRSAILHKLLVQFFGQLIFFLIIFMFFLYILNY